MTDQEFLIWVHQHLVLVHGENPSLDYMHKLRAIIEQMGHTKITPNVASPPYA